MRQGANRRVTLTAVLLGFAVCLSAVRAQDEGKDEMTTTTTERTALPPIDLALPARVETATFAVG